MRASFAAAKHAAPMTADDGRSPRHYVTHSTSHATNFRAPLDFPPPQISLSLNAVHSSRYASPPRPGGEEKGVGVDAPPSCTRRYAPSRTLADLPAGLRNRQKPRSSSDLGREVGFSCRRRRSDRRIIPSGKRRCSGEWELSYPEEPVMGGR